MSTGLLQRAIRNPSFYPSVAQLPCGCNAIRPVSTAKEGIWPVAQITWGLLEPGSPQFLCTGSGVRRTEKQSDCLGARAHVHFFVDPFQMTPHGLDAD